MQSIIKKDQVRAAAPGTARGMVPAKDAGDRCQQGLRVLREGGLVHAIEITCSCGERILVELDQPSEPESKP